MKLRFTSYLICLLFVVSFITCGGDSEEDADKQPTTPATSAGGGEALQITVDYAAEEAAIIEVMNLHAEAIGTKDADEFMPYWLRSESEGCLRGVGFLGGGV